MSWLTLHLDAATVAKLDAEAAALVAQYPTIKATREDIARSLIARVLGAPAPVEAQPKPQAPAPSVGARLRSFRKSTGLTLKQFAVECGANSAATISSIERGQTAPSYALALAIESRTGGVVTVEAFGFDRATARRAAQAVEVAR